MTGCRPRSMTLAGSARDTASRKGTVRPPPFPPAPAVKGWWRGRREGSGEGGWGAGQNHQGLVRMESGGSRRTRAHSCPVSQGGRTRAPGLTRAEVDSCGLEAGRPKSRSSRGSRGGGGGVPPGLWRLLVLADSTARVTWPSPPCAHLSLSPNVPFLYRHTYWVKACPPRTSFNLSTSVKSLSPKKGGPV